MAGKHGGVRPGAGRPRKSEKFATPIAEAEDRIAQRLPKLLESLIDQAMGWVVVEPDEEWVPAGLVTVKGPLRVRAAPRPSDGEGAEGGDGDDVARDRRDEDGEIWLDPKGKPLIVDVPVYPHLAPDVLVLVKRRTARPLPDARAAAYLIDRIMGKPTQAIEHTGEDGGPIQVDVMAAIDRFFPESAESSSET